MRMETKVFIWVLCACLVTLLVHKTSADGDEAVNPFTFLSYEPSQQGPVNGSNSEQMTNQTNTNTTQESISETTIAPNLAEQNDAKLNYTKVSDTTHNASYD